MEAPICRIGTDQDAESRDMKEFCTAVVVTVVTGTPKAGVMVVIARVSVEPVLAIVRCVAGSGTYY